MNAARLVSLLNAQRYFIMSAALGDGRYKASLSHAWDINEQIADMLRVNPDVLRTQEGISSEHKEIDELNRMMK